MRTADLSRAVLATAAGAALATGCTSTTEGSAAGPSTTAAPVEIFNPCKELSDEVLTEVGLDPSTKNVTTDPPSGPSSWRVCLWRSQDNQHFVSIFSTSHTLDEARKNPNSVQQTDTAIGSREALTFFDESETDGTSCYAAIAADQGSFHISAAWTVHGARDRDICDVATEYTSALEPSLPQ